MNSKNLVSLAAADLDLVTGGCGKPVVKPTKPEGDLSLSKPSYDGKLGDDKGCYDASAFDKGAFDKSELDKGSFDKGDYDKGSADDGCSY